jgi:hypothetical protein
MRPAVGWRSLSDWTQANSDKGLSETADGLASLDPKRPQPGRTILQVLGRRACSALIWRTTLKP